MTTTKIVCVTGPAGSNKTEIASEIRSAIARISPPQRPESVSVISIEQLIEERIALSSTFSAEAKETFYRRGRLPDQVIFDLLEKPLKECLGSEYTVIVGFPFTSEQLRWLKDKKPASLQIIRLTSVRSLRYERVLKECPDVTVQGFNADQQESESCLDFLCKLARSNGLSLNYVVSINEMPSKVASDILAHANVRPPAEALLSKHQPRPGPRPFSHNPIIQKRALANN